MAVRNQAAFGGRLKEADGRDGPDGNDPKRPIADIHGAD